VENKTMNDVSRQIEIEKICERSISCTAERQMEGGRKAG